MTETEPEPSAAALGRALLACRLDRGLTQEELADEAGLSVRTIRGLERSRVVPRRTTIGLLADALKLEPETRSHLDALLRASRVPRQARRADAWPQWSPTADGAPGEDAPAACRPAQLPHDLASFVGRQVELARLCALAEEAAHGTRICVLDGPGGVGKTALVVRLGHAAADRFPDGQLYIDLHGFHPGQPPVAAAAALGAFLRALGGDEARVPADADERAAQFRSALADKRVLIILDNAASAEQVKPLLPGRSNCLVMVTTRSHLVGLAIWAHARLSLRSLSAESVEQHRGTALLLPASADSVPTRSPHWYLAAAVAAGHRIAPRRYSGPLGEAPAERELPRFVSHLDAASWCDKESANLVAATRNAATAGDYATAWQIPWALLPYFDLRKAWDTWRCTHEIGLASARVSGDRFGEAAMLTGLGLVHYYPRRFAEATECYERAGRLWREAGDSWGEATILNALGNVHLEQRDLGGAIDRYRSALKINRVNDDRHAEGVVLNNLAETHCELGAFDRALEYASAAITVNRGTGYRRMEAFSLCHLARALAATGSLDDAISRFCEAIDVSSVIGDRQVEAWAFDYLGGVLAAAGQASEARLHWIRAIDLFDDLGDPQAADVRERLVHLR
jgi:tetratricopeptide (TPR) repeat protein/transcriptional regulator with XRE-family HTH domain